jgi:hypothetical protein
MTSGSLDDPQSVAARQLQYFEDHYLADPDPQFMAFTERLARDDGLLAAQVVCGHCGNREVAELRVLDGHWLGWNYSWEDPDSQISPEEFDEDQLDPAWRSLFRDDGFLRRRDMLAKRSQDGGPRVRPVQRWNTPVLNYEKIPVSPEETVDAWCRKHQWLTIGVGELERAAEDFGQKKQTVKKAAYAQRS